MKRTFKRIRIVISVLVILLMVWCISPVFCGVWHLGMALPFSIGLALLLCLYHWDGFKRLLRAAFQKWYGKAGIVAVSAAVLFLLSSCTVFTVMMLAAAGSQPVEGGTVVVLGAKVEADGQPSMSLTKRLDTAFVYLIEHPGAVCIVTGGQGADEPVSEARSMFEYLTERGIDPERILLEEQSSDTEENLRNTARIIEENDLNDQIIIVTDSYHQLRAQIYAQQAGLNSSPCSSHTRIDFLPGYWVREWLALAKYYFLGS